MSTEQEAIATNQEQCAFCKTQRNSGEFVTRKIFFRRRNQLCKEDLRFCKDDSCGRQYQISIDDHQTAE